MTFSVETVADVDGFRNEFRRWLHEFGHEFRLPDDCNHDEQFARGLDLSRAMWDAGWKRVGWPASLGGLGGGPRHRATYYDELCRAGIEIPDTDLSIEVIGPAMVKFSPVLAEIHLPRLLAGEEAWAQAFSEPNAGSDLASLRTRGVVTGDEMVVEGQKVWTSHGHRSARLLTLVRTGSTDSRHRGLSALLIDTDSEGLTRNPLMFANGIDEMCETFFDSVRVPMQRMVGAIDEGWDVAMFMLQYERSMYAAQRQAWLGLRIRQLTDYLVASGTYQRAMHAVDAAWLQLQTVRARTIQMVRRLDNGEIVGPEASADKILLARAEQAIFEIARNIERSQFALDDSAERWRSGWWYSRATSIIGGAREIQCSVIADRVLRLPRD